MNCFVPVVRMELLALWTFLSGASTHGEIPNFLLRDGRRNAGPVRKGGRHGFCNGLQLCFGCSGRALH